MEDTSSAALTTSITDPSRAVTLMGILNLTTDSFYGGSRLLGGDGTMDEGTVLSKAEEHIRGGATILDIGASSSRPGSEGVDPRRQISLLIPAVKSLREHFPDVALSVDTDSAQVVEALYEHVGPFTVNDISGGNADGEMLGVVSRLSLPYIAMHMRGTPRNMADLTDYGEYHGAALGEACSDVTAALISYFTSFRDKAESLGIREWILDPGFGFAKTIRQNYDILRELPILRAHFHAQGGGYVPLLVGLSRKSMAYKLLGITPEEALPATQVLHYAALRAGADILRVHDCGEAARTVRLYRELCISPTP